MFYIKNEGWIMEHERELLRSYLLAKLREGPLVAREHTIHRKRKLRFRTVFLKLKNHVDNFLDGYVENRFIVMPGLRGVGKTTLTFQLYNYLLKEKKIEKERILHISMDQLNAFLGENILSAVDVFISEIHKKSPATLDKELFIFIDEAQNDENWSQTGKILYDQSKKIFMVFTGSSAIDLEINVDAARRTKKEPVYPMNFQEYLLLKYNIYPPKGTSLIIRNMILTGDTTKVAEIEMELLSKFSQFKTPPKKEWEHYLCCGGFPLSIDLEEFDIHEKTFNMIERVIDKDVTHYQLMQNGTKSNIFKIITYLTIQNPGEISENKLATSLKISSSTVNKFLDILEKTHLIFPVKPYAGAKKTIRKPWKYYFLTPSLKTSVSFKLGRYFPEDRKFLGSLAENLVASYFFKMQKTTYQPNGIFYPPDSGHVDFLLSKFDGRIIPVEVGLGKKSKKHVNASIDKYNSDYGIIISDTTEMIKKEEDVIYLPLTTFSFI
jgi:predicted AAA+ superfamily ATPase